ncbi:MULTISPECIES: hypothetical protein [Chryseobacterium]|jgi:hypothetical protein|uniref:hypothetical protein n=1 Tax=Chryseobacterium TaxID=59732 RepID=UPI00082B9C7A|nr:MULTISPECIES: hypothetical protein [Chryseobacterium]AZA57815.1 hypothetical protein EG350_11760 [Chryseobacterium shandongense]
MADQNDKKSIFITYANISLWGGTLEGVVNTAEKFYSLKTVNPIKLGEVKIGNVNIGNEVKNANLGLEKLAVNFVVEHKADSAVKADDPKNNDDYTKMIFALSTEQGTTAVDEIKKGGFFGDNFTINSVKVGYLSYGSKEEKQSKEFVAWMNDNVKKLDK